jgi:hypothetical protein
MPLPVDSRDASEIRVFARPNAPFIEKRRGQQLINFDLLVKNSGRKAYTLVCIRLLMYDKNDRLELERELNENGKPPALDKVGHRTLSPGAAIDVFQPFSSFGPEIDLSKIRLELLFVEQGHSAPPVAVDADAIATIDVRPRTYSPVPYCLPLQGLVLVHDGHDFDSHHRRYDLVDRFEANPDSALSANLYAYDFMKTTSDGQLFQGDPNRKESWLTYDEPIFAPAPGVVLEAISDVPENTFAAGVEAQTPSDAEERDPMGFGNHVKILHADGRVSWLLHMRPGSVAVKNGQRVTTGQFLGKVGFSGDSLFPHLHYNVTNGPGYPSQGVPSYFKDYVLILGGRQLKIPVGQVDTGDMLEDAKVPCR